MGTPSRCEGSSCTCGGPRSGAGRSSGRTRWRSSALGRRRRSSSSFRRVCPTIGPQPGHGTVMTHRGAMPQRVAVQPAAWPALEPISNRARWVRAQAKSLSRLRRPRLAHISGSLQRKRCAYRSLRASSSSWVPSSSNPTLLQHRDPVGAAHRGEAVRDEDGGTVRRELLQADEELVLRFRVERGGGLSRTSTSDRA